MCLEQNNTLGKFRYLEIIPKIRRLNTTVDNLVWNVVPTINSWPTFDLFSNATNLTDYQVPNSIQIFPNLTNGAMQFSYESNVQVLDLTGQPIMQLYQTKSLDLSDQASGIYFISFINENGEVLQTRKLC